MIGYHVLLNCVPGLARSTAPEYSIDWWSYGTRYAADGPANGLPERIGGGRSDEADAVRRSEPSTQFLTLAIS